MEAYKDCAEKARVTSDVTSVRDDGKRNKAHTESAEQVYVAYDVTTLDENVLDSHKDCAENENTNCVTFVSDYTDMQKVKKFPLADIWERIFRRKV